MAEALWRLRDGRVRLLTAIGDDSDGQYLQNIAPGLLLEGCVVQNARTAVYAAIFDKKGECTLGLGDMDVHNQITVDLVDRHINVLRNAPLVVIDGNLPLSTMEYILRLCKKYEKPVFYEPTDRRKAVKALSCNQQFISYASPNMMELRAMANYLKPNNNINKSNDLEEIINLSKIILNCIHVLLVTRGPAGVVTIKAVEQNNILSKNNKKIEVRHYTSEVLNTLENVSGAGDCFSSGFINGLLLGLNEFESIGAGFCAAKDALLSKKTVPDKFTKYNYYKKVVYDIWYY